MFAVSAQVLSRLKGCRNEDWLKRLVRKIMKSYIANQLVIFFILFLPGNTFSQSPLTALVEKVQPAIVSVVAYDSHGDQVSRGSGFLINAAGDVITNWHVISGASSAMIKTFTGAMYKVDGILAKEINSDLAKISIDAQNNSFPYLNLSSNTPQTGEHVFVIGNPFGLESTVSDGLVSALRKHPDIGKIVQISAPISPGSSGSPVINLKGLVIGVASFQLIKGQNLNFAVSAEEIAKISSVAHGTLMPLGTKYMSKINTDVQLKDNGWVKILKESVEEVDHNLDSGNAKVRLPIVRLLKVQIQFLKHCRASKKELNLNEPGLSVEEFTKRAAQAMNMYNLFENLPKFNCDYRTKVFVTFFTKQGEEISTKGHYPQAPAKDLHNWETEIFPGEKLTTVFAIPTGCTSWCVWVSK